LLLIIYSCSYSLQVSYATVCYTSKIYFSLSKFLLVVLELVNIVSSSHLIYYKLF
jgi:hypothetical protein